MLEITTGVFLDRDLTKYDPEIAQICHLVYKFKFVKKKKQFHLGLNTSSLWQ